MGMHEDLVELYEIRLERLENLIEVLESEDVDDICANLPISPRDLLGQATLAIKETKVLIARHKAAAQIEEVKAEAFKIEAPPPGIQRMSPDFMPEEGIEDEMDFVPEEDEDES